MLATYSSLRQTNKGSAPLKALWVTLAHGQAVCTHTPRMQALLLLSGQLVWKLTCSSSESPKKNIQEVASSVSLAPGVAKLESQIIVVSTQLGCIDTCWGALTSMEDYLPLYPQLPSEIKAFWKGDFLPPEDKGKARGILGLGLTRNLPIRQIRSKTLWLPGTKTKPYHPKSRGLFWKDIHAMASSK